MVEIVRIPRRDVSAEVSNACFNCHAAHRQLILSPYFPGWMGLGHKNINRSEDHVDICYAYHRTVSLGSIIRKHGPLKETQPVCRFVARHVLMALIDVVEQSTHRVFGRLTMDNIRIAPQCKRVYVGGIQWGPEIPTFGSKQQSEAEQTTQITDLHFQHPCTSLTRRGH